MKLSIKTAVAIAALGMLKMVAANPGDMIIDFPGLLRPRASAVAAASSTNLFAFSSALGGAAAEPVTSTGDSTRPFAVGTNTFTDFDSAATRSCNDQHNACADVANGGSANGLTVGQCDTQQTQCEAAAASGASSSHSSSASASVASVATSAAVVVSASAAAQTVQASSISVAVVQSTSTTSSFVVQGTLHSSDENFLFFCD
ncbi:hypothetical protein BDZ45DRAFT_391038 [Acephala macrosclerotiorum]|nr:hypothetical protein BDZ45DRAFT_391038 [Acephala macrosclerotiorum]